MSGADEEWVKSAMTDDTMVVELLVHLHRTPPPPPPLKPPLGWTIRQRRSKPVSVNANKKRIHRGSPTTPLSWSSGGSPSAGFENSSRLPLLKSSSNTSRSKVDGDSTKTASKRSRKKKTFSELKEEENMLIKERTELNKEIAALRTNLEKQRAMNERFKRIKLELQPEMHKGTTSLREESISFQLQKQKTAGQSSPPIMPPIISGTRNALQPFTSNCCNGPDREESSNPKLVLPDLNMPFEDSMSDALCGVS